MKSPGAAARQSVKSTTSTREKLSATLMNRFAVFTDGKRSYALSAPGSEGAAPERAYIKIVSRTCYKEHRLSFPVKSVGELRQLVSQKYPGAQIFIGDWADNQRKVLVVEYTSAPGLLATSKGLVIPETLLLESVVQEGITEVETPAGQLYVSKKGNQISSALKGGIFSSAEAAKAALGVSSNTSTVHWSSAETLEKYQHALFGVPFADWKALYHSPVSEKQTFPWKALGVSAVALLIAYGVLSTAYLHIAAQSRQAKLESYGGTVTERLQARGNLETEVARLNALASTGQDQRLFIANWELIAMLYQQGISIQSISGDFNEMQLRAEAPAATAVVETIAQFSGVANVEFSSPVRRGRSGETFTLRITMDASETNRGEVNDGA